ncbi:MAG: peptidase T, partial [Clostridia bacterium]|nr:peptidase T [Clostridia bacterium]
MTSVTERFLRYVSFDTQSDENSPTCPSTDKQKVLGAAIVEEMLAMGIRDAYMDEHGYVYGTVPGDPNLPTIGLIAHMDTAPGCSGADIKAKIVEYNGGDICLNEEQGIFMSPVDFPSLNNHHGKHLIVTDGTTLLGADDKAGVAEILTAAERLITSGVNHATLKIGFTPDEEIGRGADKFNLK